jgi:hypothetical protein
VDEMKGFSKAVEGVQYEPTPGATLRGKFPGRWPVGQYWLPHEDLPSHLAESGRWHARRALHGWASTDNFEALSAAVSAGCAVEHLSKACLAKVSSALLLERADVDSVLHLTGNGHLAKSSPTSVRTLGATAALTALKKLVPNFPYTTADEVLFRVRNAAVHMALLSNGELNEAITSMVRLCDSLVEMSHWERDDFWGESAVAAADAVADKAATELRSRIAAKTAAALVRLNQLTVGLDRRAAGALLDALSDGDGNTLMDYEQRQICPVCKHSGWLSCAVDEQGHEHDTGEGDYWEITSRTAWPHVFECSVCNLYLEGQELREFSEIPQFIELPLENEDYEPDEDYLRGR